MAFITKRISMNKNKGIFSLVGFIMMGLGFISIVLSLIGAQLSFLVWLDSFGQLTGFVLKIMMIIVGIVIIYLTQSNFRGDQGIGDY